MKPAFIQCLLFNKIRSGYSSLRNIRPRKGFTSNLSISFLYMYIWHLSPFLDHSFLYNPDLYTKYNPVQILFIQYTNYLKGDKNYVSVL
jgi:hypothetical protein